MTFAYFQICGNFSVEREQFKGKIPYKQDKGGITERPWLNGRALA